MVEGRLEVKNGERLWLMPEFAHMAFFLVMGVVICVENSLVIVDTACTIGEC